MKKIKKKKPRASRTVPEYVVGFTHADPPPPGYLAAWFDQQYGGPLQIRFLSKTGHTDFEAIHLQWRVRINMDLESDVKHSWQERLHWEHSSIAEVFLSSHDGLSKLDGVLHVARLARGLTLLTDGTAYDVAADVYLNPSDWRDHNLTNFVVQEHIQLAQRERPEQGQSWYYTRGLSKFGLDELECLRPIGLSENVVKEVLEASADQIVYQGNIPKIGEEIKLSSTGQVVKVVRHRTDQSFGKPIAFREVQWDL